MTCLLYIDKIKCYQSSCTFIQINLLFFPGVQMQKKEKYDKHDSPNPNRANTFMSAEDVAAGKKSAWYELEITG